MSTDRPDQDDAPRAGPNRQDFQSLEGEGKDWRLRTKVVTILAMFLGIVGIIPGVVLCFLPPLTVFGLPLLIVSVTLLFIGTAGLQRPAKA